MNLKAEADQNDTPVGYGAEAIQHAIARVIEDVSVSKAELKINADGLCEVLLLERCDEAAIGTRIVEVPPGPGAPAKEEKPTERGDE